MLIWLSGNKISAYNTEILKEEAEKYLSESCVWVENELPQAEVKKGFNVYYKYENGEITAEYEKEEVPEPTEDEVIQAELLLNQAEIIAKQKEHDEVLAEILLGQQEVAKNV